MLETPGYITSFRAAGLSLRLGCDERIWVQPRTRKSKGTEDKLPQHGCRARKCGGPALVISDLSINQSVNQATNPSFVRARFPV